MKCPVCHGGVKHDFSALVLKRYEARYFRCETCGYLYAHSPDWLDEAYSSAIASADTGLVARNISIALRLASFIYWSLDERGAGRYLDAAGGYGMLTRLMRDLGFDFYWSDKYCSNLLARGFEYDESLRGFRAVTAMEVMEHLTDPVAFVDDALRIAGADTLVFTTELYAGATPGQDWWYYTFSTGQHIGFFTKDTLKIIGERLGLRFLTANGLHVLTRQSLNQQHLEWATHPWVAKASLLWIRRHLVSKTVDDHLLLMRTM